MSAAQLIVTADDFGVSHGVNRAVIDAYDAGVLTSASMVASGTAVRAAVEATRDRPDLDIGLHLVLAVGRPTAPPQLVPSLVDSDGAFHRRGELLKRALSGRIAPSDVAREFDYQFTALASLGVQPSFVNGDQHVHVLPTIRDVVLSRASSLRLPVRVPDERLVWCAGAVDPRLGIRLAKKGLLHVLCRQFRRRVVRRQLRSNDVFLSVFGLLPEPNFNAEGLLSLLTRVHRGVTEVMTHPAYVDSGLIEFWEDGNESAQDRLRELHALRDKRVLGTIADRGIELIRWRDI